MAQVMDACNAHDFILSASALSSPTLDLSRKGIVELPESIPGCSRLECLYLEGNRLSSLPESLFRSCPNLRWLDLRNNRLRVIPSSIEKLKSLRTLLLEGNQLTTLPSQLGRLHLTGLNLSHNPLQCPPKNIVEKGTQAVLTYLCELIQEGEDRENEQSCDSERHTQLTSVDSFPEYTQKRAALVHFPNRHSTPECIRLVPSLPVPLPRQVTLHNLPSPRRNAHVRKTKEDARTEETPSPEHPAKARGKKRRRRRKRDGKGAHEKENPQELSAEDKLEIATALERQSSQRCLEDWQKEARDKQRQQVMVNTGGYSTVPHDTAATKAPFATDQPQENESSQSGLTFVAMDHQRKAILYNLRRTSGRSSTSTQRDAREQQLGERVQQYQRKLQDQRKQVGLIGDPSPELIEAEKKLAEAVVLHKELETRKNREYRLTAFTGDSYYPD